ncbi:winged helix-turn-helix domain-containing protein [Solirubrobacter ginsenosidimutans]|uniref:Winged helix-turn-helix domain-containing protein n=1 Tax=Solirubrobacter ginsenosidimutans TaxID=490573 RepID=A0A9X3N0E2_9ACTN|nr:BTAD domain-containing putative transcriptional regulator [Solirubrobacter ginsenosidimutans]MDA0166356.1 winged helix-turn-helix domain-containing protein [Solirubrobacter ginsenosidimutans]
MEFRLLGPLEVIGDEGTTIAIGTGRQRALLALLILRANVLVSNDRLVEELWGAAPPTTAPKMLHNQVSALRQALGRDGPLETLGSAYRLNVGPEERDLDRFEDLVTRGRAAEPEQAAACLRLALDLWRGPPLADLAFEPFAQTEILRLDERRWAVFEAWVEAELTLGRHADLIAELEVAVAEQPLRERLYGALMLALYRCGRQADALETYRRAHHTLVEEIGVEPNGSLRALQQAILDHDPALDPLGDDAIAEIARGYGVADAAIGAIVDESHGDARAARRKAAEWAAAASAGRAANGRAELRAAERELAGDVLVRQALEAPQDDVPSPAVCPYMGLSPFDAAHAPYFFGRERLVAELVARLVGSPLLAVVGASGSGKSSAVRAGLLPALAGGALPGSDRWSVRVMRPGEHPRVQAADLLVVDQFEEVFAVCRDAAERTAFLDALVEHDGQVVLAVRADFYGRCATHERLARLVGAHQVLVGPMRRDELRRAIESPAERAGLRVEPELTDALIADVLDEPGGLPLLSAALLEQWRERDGLVMRHAAYERTGGVRGAVGRLAEHTYTQLSEPEQRAARRTLLRLAGDGDVRRRVPLAELEALDALADSRLVTVDDGAAEVAHEALLREWPRLRGWLDDDAQGRRLHLHVTEAAREWAGAGREPGELYRGARLAAALEWAAVHRGDLNPLEREFLEAGLAAAERETEAQRRANRRLRSLLAGLAVLLVVALGAGVVALHQRGQARHSAVVADANRLGADAVNEDRLDRAVLLARHGVALDDSPTTRSNLLSVLLRNPAVLGEVDTGWRMFATALSPDGRLMALGDERGNLSVYDAATRLPVGRPYWIQGGLIQSASFSPDGRTLALGSVNPAHVSRPLVDLIDPLSGRRRLRIELPSVSKTDPFVYAKVVYLPGVLAVLAGTPGGPPPVLYRVDPASGAIAGRLTLDASPGALSAGGGRLYATGAHRTWELDPRGPAVLRTFAFGDEVAMVSADGRHYALGGPGGRLRLLDLVSGAVESLPAEHAAAISALRFTPDSRTLVSADEAGKLIAWDVASRAIAQRFPGHVGEVGRLDISPDGRTLLSTGADRHTLLWDLSGDQRLDRRFAVGPDFTPIDDTPRGIAISPSGRTLALTQVDGTVDLLDTGTLRRRARLRALVGKAMSIAFSHDGRLLAATGASGRVTLWDARTLAPAGELVGLHAGSQALAFSPDGTLLAAAEAEFGTGRPPQPVRVWDVRTRRLTGFRARTWAALIAFSPNGRQLAIAADERGTEIHDVATGHLVKHIGIGDFAGDGDFSRSVAFSPDGQLLFVGQYDGHGQVYSTQTWKPVGRVFEGHTDRITFAQFSRDGRMLVTAGAEGTVILWDAATHKPIGAPLALTPGAYASVVLAGTHVYAIATTGPGISFDTSPQAWERHACVVGGHELSAQEWADALPGRPLENVCGADYRRVSG